MFRYHWSVAALDELADVYVNETAAHRERIAAGVEHFNRRLGDDPFDVGESRTKGYRVAFPPLLRVSFRVNKETRRVEVVSIIRYGK